MTWNPIISLLAATFCGCIIYAMAKMNENNNMRHVNGRTVNDSDKELDMCFILSMILIIYITIKHFS